MQHFTFFSQIPKSIIKFPLDISVAEGRARVRAEFNRYAAYFATLPPNEPSTLAAMNAAILKGTQELIEVHSRWAQKTHFMRWFEGAWERQNPQLMATQVDRNIQRINQGVKVGETSAFLDDFLTKKQ